MQIPENLRRGEQIMCEYQLTQVNRVTYYNILGLL